MTEEMKQDIAQENPSNAVENKQESPSDPSLLQEVMAKKEKIKALETEISKRDADNEKRRIAKLEEQGKLKELLTEKDSTIDNLNSKLESQSNIVSNYKQNLVNGLTSDDERKEYLSTKTVDFLEELTKEKAALEPPVSNPKESLGAVRQSPKNLKKVWDLSNEERKENWDEILHSYTKNK
ncbi:hypothetical protein CMI37_30660 [Candidatus Pacearchaeota archaeon]|nr:hypothetical protein [Candidatus Pacearchaeota archaeon]